MEYFAEGSATRVIESAEARALLEQMLERVGRLGRVLLIPPDATRSHSGAGELTAMLYELLRGSAEVVVLPALGTHVAMVAEQRTAMFPGIPAECFRVHDWRHGVVTLGELPANRVAELTGGAVAFPIRCAVNRLLVEENWDAIFSLGQLVPHEVAGIANHAKNLLVGVGGADTIHKTHYIGAVCGMEKAMGRARTPVRAVLDELSRRFIAHLPLHYVLTVRGVDSAGGVVTRGLFAGNDTACFERGARLCRTVNVTLLDEPVRRAVVLLSAEDYRTTWLGNKAIYRLRMAMADGGTLHVVAPGVGAFGEDAQIDRLIRRHGYRGTPRTLAAVGEDPELAENLAAAAHLIHGSSEGRFEIVYAPGGLTRAEVEGVGFHYRDPADALAECSRLTPGFSGTGAERSYFVTNPGLGLWSARAHFAAEDEGDC